jgi:hypothetical protein
MLRNNFNFRLRLERLEGRDAPAVVAPTPDSLAAASGPIAVHAGSDHSNVSDAGASIGEVDEVPLRVSLTAVIVIALGVSWDRHVKERRPVLRGKFTQMLSAS